MKLVVGSHVGAAADHHGRHLLSDVDYAWLYYYCCNLCEHDGEIYDRKKTAKRIEG